MPTQINNSASATYGYGRGQSDNTTSNVATASLLDQYSIQGEKGTLNTAFRPGDNLTFYVKVTNNGTSPLYNITITDDRGGTLAPLTYVAGSAMLSYNDTITSITPITSVPLVFNLTAPLNAGESAIIIFIARVAGSVVESVSEIVNTVTISANEGSASGTVIQVTPNPTVTVPRDEYAQVVLTKTVSSEEITEGVPFSYTLRLENSGNLPATGVIITDVLPSGFVISSITSTTGDTVTTFDSSDYSLESSSNTLTLPTNVSKPIDVPAYSDGNGVTTVVITGQINS